MVAISIKCVALMVAAPLEVIGSVNKSGNSLQEQLTYYIMKLTGI